MPNLFTIATVSSVVSKESVGSTKTGDVPLNDVPKINIFYYCIVLSVMYVDYCLQLLLLLTYSSGHLTENPSEKTPYELWNEEKPDLKHIKIFES